MLAMAVPLIENEVEPWKAWVRELTGPRSGEFDDFNERMGLTLHRAWLTYGPEGPLAVVVLDGPGANDFLHELARSNEAFDKWFREHISQHHGIDFSKPGALPPSEMLLDWFAPAHAYSR